MLQRRPRRGDDRGASLAELLVVMALMGLIGSMVMSVSVQVAKALRGSAERGSDAQDVRVGLEAMTRALRAAVDPDGTGPLNAFGDATLVAAQRSTRYQVVFYSSWGQAVRAEVDPKDPARSVPSRHRYWVQQEPNPATGVQEWVLRQQVWAGARDGLGNPYWPATVNSVPQPRERVLARGLVIGGGAPAPFAYSIAVRDAKGRAIGVTPATSATGSDPATATALTATEAADVRAVGLTLRASRTAGAGTRPVNARTSVTVENNPEVKK